MLKVAEDDPIFYELLRIESALEPVSQSARRLRNTMGRIEPAELTYSAQLDAVFEALCSGETPDSILVCGGFQWSSNLWDQRKAQLREQAKQLRLWIDDGSGSLAGILGERRDAKIQLARLTLHELETEGSDVRGIEELRADPALGAFAHRIEMLDGELWSHDDNFDLLMRSIAQLRPIGEWHAVNGPLAWGDADPACKPKVGAMLTRLDTWVAGNEDAELGACDAYAEKIWLARCLATYLRYHLKDCWNWMENEEAEKAKALLTGQKYGFRVDPMTFGKKSGGVRESLSVGQQEQAHLHDREECTRREARHHVRPSEEPVERTEIRLPLRSDAIRRTGRGDSGGAG